MINVINKYNCCIHFYGAILAPEQSIRVKISKVDYVLEDLIYFVNKKALSITCDVEALNNTLKNKIKDKIITKYSSVAYNPTQNKFIAVEAGADTPFIEIEDSTPVVSATETVKPEEVVSATETVKPEEVVSATETVQPEEVVSATETVKPEEVVSATETVDVNAKTAKKSSKK